jgi:hypothetical protein
MNQQLQNDKYLVIRGFVEPERAKELSQKFVKHCDETSPSGDIAVPDSFSVYNYIPFVDLMCEKTNEVSSLLGERVIPSYAYSRIYKKGNELKPHHDRDGSEIALSVCLAFDQEWPLWFYGENKQKIPVILQPGDAVLYFGKEIIHWRDKFEGSFSNSAFIFYVRSEGPFADDFFDNKTKGYLDTLDDQAKKEFKDFFKPRNQSVKKTEKAGLNGYVKVIQKAIPEKLCSVILQEFGESGSWAVDNKLQKISKNCNFVYLSSPEVINKNPTVRSEVDRQICEIVKPVIYEYVRDVAKFSYTKDLGYVLFRVAEGGWIDTTLMSPGVSDSLPAVQIMFCLNTPKKGGEITLFEGKLTLSPKQGDAIVIPNNFLFPVGVMPVITGDFTFLSTWIA